MHGQSSWLRTCMPTEQWLAQMGPSKIRVYGLGQWFVPCVWDDQVCHKAMAVEVGHSLSCRSHPRQLMPCKSPCC